MFEVGFTEIVLIFAIALLVLGPARLPKLAADLGRWAGRARSMARQLRTQLEQARDAVDAPEASGEAIAQEFERYLRRRGDGPEGRADGRGDGNRPAG